MKFKCDLCGDVCDSPGNDGRPSVNGKVCNWCYKEVKRVNLIKNRIAKKRLEHLKDKKI